MGCNRMEEKAQTSILIALQTMSSFAIHKKNDEQIDTFHL